MVGVGAVSQRLSLPHRVDRYLGVGDLRPCLTKIYMGSIHRVSSQVCSYFTFQFDFPGKASQKDWQLLAPDSEFEFDAGISQVIMPLNGTPIRKDDASLEFLVARTRHGPGRHPGKQTRPLCRYGN